MRLLPALLVATLVAVALPVRTAPAAPLPAESSAQPAAQVAAPPPACPPDKELCVQAEHTGGIDLKTGVAHLEGNVRGVVRSRGLSFQGGSLTAYRDGGQEWVRLVLEQDVRLSQDGRESESDHGVLERDQIRLTGNVRIEQPDLRIEGNEAEMHADGKRTIVRGQAGAPLTMQVQRALLVEGDGPAPADADVTTELRAQKAVLEDQPRRAVLTGNVHIEQSNQRLRVDAQEVTLLFARDSTLESFRADGHVVIAQPQRRITADFAQSRNNLRTILLVGHATMQQEGQFELKSDRMEVYADADKGVMETHDRQKPITLSLDLAGGQTYGLTQAGMLKLSQKSVPPAVLDKLAPLIGETFKSRAAFREAVAGRLTRRESDAHLETILANAR